MLFLYIPDALLLAPLNWVRSPFLLLPLFFVPAKTAVKA